MAATIVPFGVVNENADLVCRSTVTSLLPVTVVELFFTLYRRDVSLSVGSSN